MDKTYWKDKKVCFLGDSITEGFAINPDERYFELLARDIGIKAYSYGVCGARFDNLMAQAEHMRAEHGDDVDAIFIFAGTNDYNGSVPIGEWFDVAETEVVAKRTAIDGEPVRYEKRLIRSHIMDRATVKSAINRLMIFLKTHYGTKRIVIMTPIHRAFATFSGDNIQYDEMYSNSSLHFFDEYVATVREAASVFATELVDLYSISGLYPLADCSAKAFFANEATDRLHPSKGGHAVLAEMIKRYLP